MRLCSSSSLKVADEEDNNWLTYGFAVDSFFMAKKDEDSYGNM